MLSNHSNFSKPCTVLHFQVTRRSGVLLRSQSAEQPYLMVLHSLILISMVQFRDQSSAAKGSWAKQSVTLQRVQGKSVNNVLLRPLSSLLLWAYMRMCTSTSCFFLDHAWIRCKTTLNQWHRATEDRWRRTERVFPGSVNRAKQRTQSITTLPWLQSFAVSGVFWGTCRMNYLLI